MYYRRKNKMLRGRLRLASLALLMVANMGVFYPALSLSTTSPQNPTFAAPGSEIRRRRNIAIISHPDSGKTTMTEKLLLHGGAIQQAGAVRQKGEQRRTASDFMQMEQERGISISATAMSFDFNGQKVVSTPLSLCSLPTFLASLTIPVMPLRRAIGHRCSQNVLDTPGHQDFSEDTYRALAAADNALMLLDAAKGLEPQTKKLFEVCRMRGLPIFSFCNKLDRPALTPLEIMDQIEAEFGLETHPGEVCAKSCRPVVCNVHRRAIIYIRKRHYDQRPAHD